MNSPMRTEIRNLSKRVEELSAPSKKRLSGQIEILLLWQEEIDIIMTQQRGLISGIEKRLTF